MFLYMATIGSQIYNDVNAKKKSLKESQVLTIAEIFWTSQICNVDLHNADGFHLFIER